MKSVSERQRAVCALALAAFLGSCGGGGSTAPGDAAPAPRAPRLSRIAVGLGEQTLDIGRTTVATVAGVDDAGSAIGVPTPAWSSSATSVATVDDAGLVTAVGSGFATIVATTSGFTASAQLTVVPPPPPATRLALSPATAAITVGDQLPLAATVVRADGSAVPAANVVWSSNRPFVATASAGGVVSGLAVGDAVISATATVGAVALTGTAAITVLPRVDSSITITVLAPAANAAAGDTLDVVAYVASLRPIVRATAAIDGTTFDMLSVQLGARGTVPGWGVTIAFDEFTIGTHRLVVTAFEGDGGVRADTMTIERQARETGGNAPAGGKKSLRPVTPAKPAPIRRPGGTSMRGGK